MSTNRVGNQGSDSIFCKGDAEDPVNNEDCGERTGLTPDWVIQATAYSVFQLQVGVQGKEQIRVNTTVIDAVFLNLVTAFARTLQVDHD